MKEIEVKILEIDEEEVKKRLLDLGAEKTFEGEIEVYRIDFDDDRLDKSGEFLRVRKVGDQTELCFKGKKEESRFKVREEIEVNTSCLPTTIKIFEKLGFKNIFDGKKLRTSYKLEDVKFEIDKYPEIPVFLEIEAPTEEDVKEYVQKLGYTMEQTTNMSGFELGRHYKKKFRK